MTGVSLVSYMSKPFTTITFGNHDIVMERGYYGVYCHFQQYFSFQWRLVVLVHGTGVPGETHRPVASH